MTVATVIVVAYSVISCGGVLQRMYVAAWRLGAPAAGRFWIDMRARAVWAIGFMLYIGATFAQPDASGDVVVDRSCATSPGRRSRSASPPGRHTCS